MDNVTILGLLIAAAVPILSGLGSWVAVKIAIARLQVQVETVTKSVDQHKTTIDRLKEDSLVHDMELESALAELKMSRVRRQRVRD